MNSDDLEQHLQRQPSRKVPETWRAEILAAARDAAAPRVRTSIGERPGSGSFISTLNSRLSALLWPSPLAWAGLTAVWLVILTLNSASADKTRDLAKSAPPTGPEIFLALREQERILEELIGPREPRVADRPKPAAPRPRSERRNALLMG